MEGPPCGGHPGKDSGREGVIRVHPELRLTGGGLGCIFVCGGEPWKVSQQLGTQAGWHCWELALVAARGGARDVTGG